MRCPSRRLAPARPAGIPAAFAAVLAAIAPIAPIAAIAPLAPLGAQLASPVLEWQRGGCFASWCQTGWYASPAIADLDGDGANEVVWASYDVVALAGADGALRWRGASPNRSFSSPVVADLDGDGGLEIVVARSSDTLTVHDAGGAVRWSRNPFGLGELRTLAAADLDRDGTLEIVVGRAGNGATRQVSVYEHDGALRPGWPARRDGEPGYGWGMYNQNVAIADLDGDGDGEVIAPTDTHYVTALDDDGNQLAASAIYGASKVWSQVGVHVDHAVDLRGWANCGLEHRPNFANGSPAIGDVDRDGTLEIAIPGDVYDCAAGDGPGDLYYTPWLLRADRSRYQASGFDWTAVPLPGPGSGPLSQDYAVIENAVVNVVLADLDGDQLLELLYASYDGRLHAVWLDRTEHGQWPYQVPGAGIRFASEPAVADLDGDGRAEVLFGSWPEKGTNEVGRLHVLAWDGQPLFAVDLPPPHSGDWNGALGAPALGQLDGDAELEVVLGTSHSGVVAYELPGSARHRVRWGTARGGPLRAATPDPLLFADAFESGDTARW